MDSSIGRRRRRPTVHLGQQEPSAAQGGGGGGGVQPTCEVQLQGCEGFQEEPLLWKTVKIPRLDRLS